MGFSEAVQWWDECQLRVLVLASLFIQYFLLVTAPLRKHRISPGLRSLIWLAYLGGDAVAIYALAALFNRHKKQEWVSTHRGSASLEALWAPILLLHLGGQDGITAYNIEDNELWTRHVLTAVSQVTVAIYVFRKSWSGDKRLLQAAILIFVAGVLKCFEKPWALKNASINSIVNKLSEDKSFKTIVDISSTSCSNKDGKCNIKSLDEYVQTAVNWFGPTDNKDAPPAEDKKHDNKKPRDEPYNLFVDIAFTYSERLRSLKYLVQQDKGKAHELLKSGLSNTFDRLYTKEEVRPSCLDIFSSRRCRGQLVRYIVIYLTFVSIGLFHKSNREAYNDTADVKVTYILLCCTAVLEFITKYQRLWISCIGFFSGPMWPDHIAQYNLIWHLARNKKHSRLRCLAAVLGCMKPSESSAPDITWLVHGYVKDGWERCIKDVDTYRAFNDNRGQQTLQREECRHLEQSLRKPFDESILLWHLATDFCFYQMKMANPEAQGDARYSREMSNYMAYLLFVNPEMVMAGARRSLFKEAYDVLKKMGMKNTSLDEEELIKKMIEKVENAKNSSLVHEAWVLAQGLMLIGKNAAEGEKKTWRVIQGVWVEMLCFSAGRCRGYLHAKSLGKGGEYLSYVWLLLSYMGMETLAEKLQRTERQEGDMGTVVGDENA